MFSINNLHADCSDLDSTQCIEWAQYCEWNEDIDECQEIGGDDGPYDYGYLTETDGIRQSSLYNGTLLYYPINAIPPYTSIILIDAFGDEYGLQGWAEFYASHGFIAMTIGNFDRSARDFDSGWDYADRALGLLDATQTIKEENLRELSPLFGQVDTSSFAVSGYSTSGGGAHTAVTMDSTLKAAILLNPAVAFLDSLNCPPETNYYCLIEEHLNHNVPVLIFSGEYELDELISPDDSVYSNMWALPQYHYVPETTDKLYFESADEGHGSSSFPNGDIADFALAWLKKYLLDDDSYCEFLIEAPQSTSQFLTTLECNSTIEWNFSISEPIIEVFGDDDQWNPGDMISIAMDFCNNTDTGHMYYPGVILNSDSSITSIVNNHYWLYGMDSDSCNTVLFSVFADSTINEDTIITFSAYPEALNCQNQPEYCINGDTVNFNFPVVLQYASNNNLNLLPIHFTLHQNYPNPFNPITNIRYDLPEATNVNIAIYDMMGRQVKNLINTNQNSGYKSIIWNGTNDNGEMVSGGMYFYSIKTNTFSQTRKMILLK